MKKLIFTLAIAVGIFTSCDEDEKIDVKDYDLKNFVADLGFDTDAAHGEVQYKVQTYFAFGNENAVATGDFGEASWTDFNLLEGDPDYNVSTDVDGWDVLFSTYTVGIYDPDEDETVPYGVTGALINTENSIQVAMMEYTESEDEAVIAQAFADLTLTDISGLTFSSDMDAIGYDWKSFSLSEMMYTVKSNWFYAVRMSNGDTYKLRFKSFYGTSTDERVANFDYQLMQ